MGQLEWSVPDSDGGDPNGVKYVIEQLLEGGNWSQVNDKPIKERKYIIDNLADNALYSFRVKTINKAGSSKEVEVRDVTTRERYELPLILLDSEIPEEGIDIYNEKTIRIYADIGGRPAPSVAWEHNGEELVHDDKRVIIEHDEGDYIHGVKGWTRITVKNTTRKDWGNYKIVAKNPAGTKHLSVPVNVRDISGPVEDLKLKEIDHSHAVLAWHLPADDGGCQIKGYYVQKRDMNMNAWLKVDTVQKPTIDIINVLENNTYVFKVSVLNECGKSEPVSLGPFVIQDPKTPPARAEHLRIVDKKDKDITLSWFPPRSDGGSPLTGYNIDSKIVGEPAEVIEERKQKKLAEKEKRKLAKEEEQKIADEQAALLGNPDEVEGGEPVEGETEGTTSEGETGTEETATDGEEEEDKEEDISGLYDWEPCNVRMLIDPAAKQYTVTTCKLGFKYRFRIKAINAVGQSDPAMSMPVTAKEDDCPPEVALECGIRGTLTIMAGTTMTLPAQVLGVPSPECLWKHKYQAIELEGEDCEYKVMRKEKACHLIVNDVQRKHGGAYQMEASNQHGLKIVRAMVIVNDMPYEPINVHATQIFANEVMLAWKAPEDDGGAEIMNYIVEKREGRKREWTQLSSTLIDNRFRVTKLQEGLEYQFRVCAENKFGVGKWGMTGQIRPVNPWTVPDPVFTPEISEITKSSMLLKWDEPAKDNGASIEGYFIEMRDNGNPKWRKVNRAPITKPPVRTCEWRVLHLNKGLNYEFRVCAINKAGAGPYGPSSDPICAKDPTFVPGPPGRPEIVDTTPGTISVMWDKPKYDGNCDILGYMVSIEDEITCEWQTIQVRDPEEISEEEKKKNKKAALSALNEEQHMSADKEKEMQAKTRKKSRRMSKQEFEDLLIAMSGKK